VLLKVFHEFIIRIIFIDRPTCGSVSDGFDKAAAGSKGNVMVAHVINPRRQCEQI
jgi:hypothetical protein